MELKNATINFLGDSITEGHGTTAPDKVFHQIIKEAYQLNHAYNYGVGGTRIARQIVPTKDATRFDLTFELRSEIMDKSADAIVVFGGTNDYGHGDAPFGTLEGEDIYTFCGALNSLIKRLKRNFPQSKLIFMTPIHRTGEEKPSKPDAKNLEDYVNAILSICKRHNVPAIDLFRIDPLDPTDSEVIPDGLHPNDKGHAVMARVIAEELLKV